MNLEIIRIEGLQKYFGPKVVLENITLSLSRGERAALVGENGAGKTTLARIIAGEETADAGSVRFAPGTEMGYLPQEVTAGICASVRGYVERAIGHLDLLRGELHRLEQRMAEVDGAELDTVLERYGVVQEEFQQRGGYDLDARMEQVFAGLQIDHLDRERPIGSLSGGEKTRVALAALLLREPDLLILDEPTNHLDFAGLEWLENYLAAYPHALLLISHDRQFINRVVNQIIELSPQTHDLTIYHGDYDAYLAQREHQYEQAMLEFEQQRDEMARLRRLMKTKAHNPRKVSPPKDGDKFYISFKTGRNEGLQSREIRNARQRLVDLEDNRLENPNRNWHIAFDFDPEPLPSTEPVRLMGISKSYSGRALLRGVQATLEKGERAVLLAPNGTGKTTLLRIIAGEVQPDGGRVVLAPSARPGYLDQEAETFMPETMVLEAFREDAQGTDKELLTQLHRSGLFTGDLPGEKQVGDLSVGQRRKLGLARIIAARANVLLLDEPTNHLDFASLEALEDALIDFPGAILAVSHDRRFIERVATQIWQLQDGILKIESR